MPQRNSKATTPKATKESQSTKRIGGGAGEESLSTYLRSFPSLPLLTREQELALGRRIQKGRTKRVRAEARAKLILHNTRLVVKEALKYASKNRIERDSFVMDVISEGMFGLLDAADRYDPERGCRFSTYATYWIRRHILKALNAARMIRVPYYMHGILAKIPWAASKIAAENGSKAPGDAEMAELMKCTPQEYRRTLLVTSSTRVFLPSTDASPASETGTGSYVDYCEDPQAPEAETTSILNEENELVWLVLSKMEDKEAHILMLRNGFGPEKRYTLQAIGRMLDLSRERVRQLEADATEHFHQRYLEVKRERSESSARRPAGPSR
jgi:RNA polymerase primary sigma factor